MKTSLIKCKATLYPNYSQIPVNVTNDYKYFNQIYQKYMYLPQLKRTNSGAINVPLIGGRGISLTSTLTLCEIVVCDTAGFFRLQFTNSLSNDNKHSINISGMQVLKKFKKELASIGINLDDYAIAVGVEVKNTIPKALIKIASKSYLNITFTNCHHLDRHSSHPAGIKEFEPKFAPILDKWYNAKENARTEEERVKYKAYLNLLWGTMQSIYIDCKFAQISKFALERTNEEVEKMANWLKLHNRTVLLYNTDGLWYTGARIPQKMLSSAMGGWSEDYHDCKFRAKSDGCYEVEGYDKHDHYVYKPVVRGKTKLDECKPRSEWCWGDIYKDDANKVAKYYIDSKVGIVPIFEEIDNAD